MEEEIEEEGEDAGAPVPTTGAGGPPAPTTGGGGLPSPAPTTAGETTAAGAGATPPGGGNILPADTESPPAPTNTNPTSTISTTAQCGGQPDQIFVLFTYNQLSIVQYFVIFLFAMID